MTFVHQYVNTSLQTNRRLAIKAPIDNNLLQWYLTNLPTLGYYIFPPELSTISRRNLSFLHGKE